MLSSYQDLKEKIEEVRRKLEACSNRLEEIKAEEKTKYPNPQLRLWTENVKNLVDFVTGLEEWLGQPLMAEAKRYLSDLKKWSEAPEKISLAELEKDWRFLSDNVEEIKEIHTQIESIEYETIKKKVSGWVVRRITEKDLDRARSWAINANEFARDLRELEHKAVESVLGQHVRRDAIEALLEMQAFEKNNKETINKYGQLIDKADTIIKNKPAEIKEEAILETYRTGEEPERSLSTIDEEIGRIRNLLIALEWVKENAKLKKFHDYNELWTEKQAALEKNDLKGIVQALQSTQNTANAWSQARKEEIHAALITIDRMSKSMEKDDVKREIAVVKERIESINWNKPDVESVYGVLSQMDTLRKQLQEELIGKLGSEDAMSIIEEPEIINDLGKNRGWDFERFMRALEVVLRNGLIRIRVAEEK